MWKRLHVFQLTATTLFSSGRRRRRRDLGSHRSSHDRAIGPTLPRHVRRVRYHDVEHDRRLSFLTNNFDLLSATVRSVNDGRYPGRCSVP